MVVADKLGQTAIRDWTITVKHDQDDDGQESCDGDCNDADPSIYVGAMEIPGDGIDQDCDGLDPARSVKELTAGDLLLTEVMVDPATGPDLYCAWVELFNNTPYSIDLNGLVITDDDEAGEGQITTPILLASGDVAVLARGDAKTFQKNCEELYAAIPIDGYYGSGLAIANAGEALWLEDGADGILNAVETLPGDWAAAHFNAALYSGVPGSLSPTANLSIDDWCISTANPVTDILEARLVDYGTPGDFEGDACL